MIRRHFDRVSEILPPEEMQPKIDELRARAAKEIAEQSGAAWIPKLDEIVEAVYDPTTDESRLELAPKTPPDEPDGQVDRPFANFPVLASESDSVATWGTKKSGIKPAPRTNRWGRR